MPTLFTTKSSYPKPNAQENLVGRTHYVDDNTLRFHHSKIISASVHDNGLLFSIVTSDALDMNNTKRGFRYVIFDVFGTVVARQNLEQACRTSAQASKAMYATLNNIDAYQHTREAVEAARVQFERELTELVTEVDKLEHNKAA